MANGTSEGLMSTSFGENAEACVRRLKSLRTGSGEERGAASWDVCRDRGAVEDMPSGCVTADYGCHGGVRGTRTSKPNCVGRRGENWRQSKFGDSAKV